jgi:hypothetical protein
MTALRQTRLALLVLAVAALQALLPLAAHAKATREGALSQDICSALGVRQIGAAGDAFGPMQAPVPTRDAQGHDGHCPLCASASLLPVQALINQHIHESPTGLNRLAATCMAPAGDAAPAPPATGPPGHG